MLELEKFVNVSMLVLNFVPVIEKFTMSIPVEPQSDVACSLVWIV
jgi:hypothetical protein